ncbi:MAG TPA: response regulator [Bacillota bacterium]|nr:response regulator [Bacillota bacterium]
MRQEPLKILIVDDQTGVRYLLDVVAREAGYRTETAKNGLEAISSVFSFHPDLVFMDVRMPVMGGLEALEKIKSQFPGIDIIIMTAYGSDETVALALEKGAMRCIAKPFDVLEIKEFLEEYTAKRQKSGIAAGGNYA